MNLKTCCRCKEEKQRSEFGKDKNRKDGLCPVCRECRRQYNKDPLVAERRRIYYKEYSKENKEKIRQQQRQYRKDPLVAERKRIHNKEYNKENKEEISQYKKIYHKENAEEIRQKVDRRHAAQRAAVYGIKNTVTGQIYVGQSTALGRRWNEHKGELRRNKHDNSRLQEDYNKYGLDVFEFEVIKEFPCDTTSDVLLEEETRTIIEYIRRRENLYNHRVDFKFLT